MAVNTWEVQKAVYTLLQADTDLEALVSDRIYDDRPDNQEDHPFVSFGPSVNVNDDTVDADGLEHTMTIDIWSRHKGMKEIKQIAQAIRAALHCQELTVTGLTSCIAFNIGGQDLPLDPDGKTRHGVMRFEFNCRA